MFMISLTNTNNQNICWDDLSTFEHNLLHLDEKGEINKEKYLSVFFLFQNTKFNKQNIPHCAILFFSFTLPLIPLISVTLSFM